MSPSADALVPSHFLFPSTGMPAAAGTPASSHSSLKRFRARRWPLWGASLLLGSGVDTVLTSSKDVKFFVKFVQTPSKNSLRLQSTPVKVLQEIGLIWSNFLEKKRESELILGTSRVCAFNSTYRFIN